MAAAALLLDDRLLVVVGLGIVVVVAEVVSLVLLAVTGGFLDLEGLGLGSGLGAATALLFSVGFLRVLLAGVLDFDATAAFEVELLLVEDWLALLADCSFCGTGIISGGTVG